MSIITLAGSPSQRSRSSALLRHAANRLRAGGWNIGELGLRDIPAEELIEGHYASPAAGAARPRRGRRRGADLHPGLQGLVRRRPEGRAGPAGREGAGGQVVLPIATGGSPAHLLALEYGLKPVLSALGARHILAGVYATDKQVRVDEAGQPHIDDDVRQRLEDSVDRLSEQLRPHAYVANEAYDLGRLALAGGFSV